MHAHGSDKLHLKNVFVHDGGLTVARGRNVNMMPAVLLRVTAALMIGNLGAVLMQFLRHVTPLVGVAFFLPAAQKKQDPRSG